MDIQKHSNQGVGNRHQQIKRAGRNCLHSWHSLPLTVLWNTSTQKIVANKDYTPKKPSTHHNQQNISNQQRNLTICLTIQNSVSQPFSGVLLHFKKKKKKTKVPLPQQYFLPLDIMLCVCVVRMCVVMLMDVQYKCVCAYFLTFSHNFSQASAPSALSSHIAVVLLCLVSQAAVSLGVTTIMKDPGNIGVWTESKNYGELSTHKTRIHLHTNTQP